MRCDQEVIMVDWNAVRNDFPVMRDNVYFISAGMSPLPNQVLKRIQNEYKKLNEYGDILWDDDKRAYCQLLERIGGMINTKRDDLAILQNTSLVMSTVAMSLKNNLRGDFNVVSMMDEFPSTTVPFEYQGIQMKYVQPEGARYSVEKILEQVDDKTAAVVTSYVQYSTGFRQDLGRLGSELKKRGILFIVNATQGFPFFPVDVKGMKIDAMSCSLHKWGFAGYVGSIFYTSSEFRKKFKPPMAGWLSVIPDEGGFVYTKKNSEIKLHDSADRYIQGCFNLQGIQGSLEAFDYLQKIGLEKIRDRIFGLADYLIKGLIEKGVRVVSPIRGLSERSAIVSFNIGNKTKELVSFLEKNKVYLSYRNGSARVALNIFNNEEDVERLIRLLTPL
jgi:cysteine desulfurase/selenocysteine lyase